MQTSITSLRILHTNDIHSHFENMPQIKTAMKRLSQNYAKEQLLIMDIGDHMDRMRPETEGSDGLANIEVMNETGYELAVLGNNEGLTFTRSKLTALYSRYAKFTVLNTNLYEKENGHHPHWTKPYAILNKSGVRVGVIGATVDFTTFYQLLGWNVEDPVVAVKHWVNKLRGQVDVFVVMSHLGIHRDRLLAEQIPGIDIIIGAHTHHLLLEPERRNGVSLFAAGKFGTHVGYIDIEWDHATNAIHLIQGGCHHVKTEIVDPKIGAITKKYERLSSKKLSIPVTNNKRKLSIAWEEESPLGNLLSAGIKKWTHTDIAIINSGQLLQSLLPGSITQEMILELCPSPINPCRMRLAGRHILDAVEQSLLVENCRKRIQGFGFRGSVLGHLCLDGIIVYYDPEAPPMQKVKRLLVGNEQVPLELDRLYSVGTLDMFTFGIGYPSLKEGVDIEYYLPEFIRDVLTAQLRDQNELKRSFRPRWFPINQQ